MSAPARFIGWRIVACLALVQGCGIGLLQAFGVLVPAVSEAFALSDQAVGLGMTVFVGGLAMAGALLGALIDRGPVRIVMAVGVLLMLGGGWAVTRVSSASWLAAAFLLMSIGIAAYGPLPVNAIIVRWFESRRGVALAIAAAGPAVAGFGIPLLTARLLAWLEWQGAILALALGAGAIALLLIAFGVLARPEDAGQNPDGRPEAGRPLRTEGDGAISDFVRERDFWLIALGFGLVFCLPLGVGPFLPKYLMDQGVGLDAAALSVSIIAVFGFVGSLAGGALADRFGPKPVLLGMLGVGAAAFATILVAPGYASTLVAGGGLGLATGAAGPFHPLIVGGRFGPDAVGRVMGLQGPIGLPFLLAAAPVVGGLADRTGDYAASFATALAVLLLGAGLLAATGARPRVETLALDPGAEVA